MKQSREMMMSRRKPNAHTIVRGAMRKRTVGMASRTKSGRARLYFATPPTEGWTGGKPEDNGWRGRGARK